MLSPCRYRQKWIFSVLWSELLTWGLFRRRLRAVEDGCGREGEKRLFNQGFASTRHSKGMARRHSTSRGHGWRFWLGSARIRRVSLLWTAASRRPQAASKRKGGGNGTRDDDDDWGFLENAQVWICLAVCLIALCLMNRQETTRAD